jgi:hypothetical protein
LIRRIFVVAPNLIPADKTSPKLAESAVGRVLRYHKPCEIGRARADFDHVRLVQAHVYANTRSSRRLKEPSYKAPRGVPLGASGGCLCWRLASRSYQAVQTRSPLRCRRIAHAESHVHHVDVDRAPVFVEVVAWR